MKKYLQLLALFSLLAMFSCGSVDGHENNHKRPFKKLDSLQGINRVINYSLTFDDKKWFSYNKSSKIGKLYYFMKINDDRFHPNFSRASITVSNNEVNKKWKKPISIEDYLKRFLELKKKLGYEKFNYSLININHVKYGKAYVVKFKDIRKYHYTHAVFLFFHKNYGYTIEYSVLAEYFDQYLPEVEKIIKSFRIKE